MGQPDSTAQRPVDTLPALLRTLAVGRAGRITHVEQLPARAGTAQDWPPWAAPAVRRAMESQGVRRPWTHQVEAADAAWAGRHVVVSTGTASGKSLAYLLPALSRIAAEAQVPSPTGRTATVIYLSPTKALAADQLSAIERLSPRDDPLPGLRAATYDGDTPPEERRWVREHASYVLTNPDMLHHSLLPGHTRWAPFLRALSFVVVDECHGYRGVFGSHVAMVLRRLRRVAARYGADPTFVLASATVATPADHARRLTGLDVQPVTLDGSPRGRSALALWEPPLLPGRGENGAPVRRSASTETGELLADLVASGVRTLAFGRSRRGVESIAAGARRGLAEVDPDLVERVAAYRGGYLPEDRRELERALRSGELLGLATTNALELGVDVSGLDAVLLAGWPGTRASLWQQVGRAGRAGRESAAVLVGADDPLDTYLMHHPEALFGRPVEASVLDPDNPYVLAPHLAAAAAELPIGLAETELFGPTARGLLDVLVQRGVLRRRSTGWFWTRPERATDHVDLRGSGATAYRVVEERSGRVVGTVDAGAAYRTVHRGAVYVHQGQTYLVRELDLAESVALVELVELVEPEWTTYARELSAVDLVATERSESWGPVETSFGTVDVTSQVVGFLRRLPSGEVLGEEPLDLPATTLRTKAVWWTMPPETLAAVGISEMDVPGAAHAAEHAAIGMMPLVATCDRWDIGGVSTALHPDTGLPTIVVHDGHPGGAGFAERGYAALAEWLIAARDAVASCECDVGCPSCVQSPQCGNGNEPLDKAGAIRLLNAVLTHAPGPVDALSPTARQAGPPDRH
jgi:DEAD/DEAH box helicase domain-containing protein